jgi:hypothetical protein
MKVEKQAMVGDDAKCPFGTSIPNILLLNDVHICLHELLTFMQVKMSRLESKKVKLDEKFIGLLLNMDDCKSTAIKAQDDMALIELDIRVDRQSIQPLKEKEIFLPT